MYLLDIIPIFDNQMSLEEYAHIFYRSEFWYPCLNGTYSLQQWNVTPSDVPEFIGHIYRIRYEENLLDNIAKELRDFRMMPELALTLLELILPSSDKIMDKELIAKFTNTMEGVFLVYINSGFNYECRLRFVHLCALAEENFWVQDIQLLYFDFWKKFVQRSDIAYKSRNRPQVHFVY